MRPEPCFLCSATTGDIRHSLVEWAEPVGGIRFTSGPRCVDRQGCRVRVEASGMTWEVVDGTVPLIVERAAEPVRAASDAVTDGLFA